MAVMEEILYRLMLMISANKIFLNTFKDLCIFLQNIFEFKKTNKYVEKLRPVSISILVFVS